MFEIEKEFSRISGTKGFKEGNFTYASDDATVFRPVAINAKEWASKQSDSIYGIRWYPSFIDISAAGDLGYAVGPFENHYDAKDTSKYILGQFATVWKKQSDGFLKFIMDFGTNQLPKAFKLVREPIYQPNSKSGKPGKFNKIENKKTLDNIRAVEKEFSEICEKSGDKAAYKKYAGKNIRFFYQKEFYLLGLDSVISILSTQNGWHKWTINNLNVAESGDLVHIWGTHEFTENGVIKNGYFMRIWKNGDNKNWKIVLQVRSIAPVH